MLIPRFTLRFGLIGLTLGALTAIVAREALGGQPWAFGVMVAIGVAALSLLLQALHFGVAMLVTRRGRRGDA